MWHFQLNYGYYEIRPVTDPGGVQGIQANPLPVSGFKYPMKMK